MGWHAACMAVFLLESYLFCEANCEAIHFLAFQNPLRWYIITYVWAHSKLSVERRGMV